MVIDIKKWQQTFEQEQKDIGLMWQTSIEAWHTKRIRLIDNCIDKFQIDGPASKELLYDWFFPGNLA